MKAKMYLFMAAGLLLAAVSQAQTGHYNDQRDRSEMADGRHNGDGDGLGRDRSYHDHFDRNRGYRENRFEIRRDRREMRRDRRHLRHDRREFRRHHGRQGRY